MHEKSIVLLNKAVADELSAVHQYMYFHFHLDDQGYDLLSSMFKRIAIQEMGHVEVLAERILFLKGEVEILQLAVYFLESFGANEKQFEVLINDRQIVDAIFHTKCKLSETQIHDLYKIIDKSKKITPDALKAMMDKQEKMTDELKDQGERIARLEGKIGNR